MFLQVCNTLSLQQGELEMRKNRASRCQHLCRSWVGSLLLRPQSLHRWRGRGNGHEPQVIGGEFRLKGMLRCLGTVTPCMQAVAGCPAAVILQTGTKQDPSLLLRDTGQQRNTRAHLGILWPLQRPRSAGGDLRLHRCDGC